MAGPFLTERFCGNISVVAF
jgi:hypothetical protein